MSETKSISTGHLKTGASYVAWRFHLLLGLILSCILGLFLRIFDLAILDQRFLRHEGDERALRLVKAPAVRGMIVDRNGYPLAVSTRVFSVWANPKEVPLDKKIMNELGKRLQLPAAKTIALIKRYQSYHKEFVYLKRGIAPSLAEEIKALHIPGVYLEESFKRYYPEGEVAAHVLGYTDIDDRGQEGVELAYNAWLSGEPGQKWVIKDRLGRIISDVKLVSPEKPGKDLILSIDRRMQYLAYLAINEAVKGNDAESGSAIVLDAHSGEVLAMANYPAYNPNNKPARVDARFRNRAITDTFEPGSTIKAFSVASALDSGTFTADSIIDTSPGWIKLGRNIKRDERNYGKLTVAQILQVSSNIGITKLTLVSPPYQLWDLLRRVGFGEITGIGFPGEQSGAIVNPFNLGPFNLATLSWGYGLSVTALQLARAYLVFANAGKKIPVTLLKLNAPPIAKPVIEPKVAEAVVSLLETVVTKGTGKLANIPDYRVAGKTGTSELASNKGYQKHRNNASFVGIAPLNSTQQLVVAVIVHDPKGKLHTGATVAAPVFEKIMEGSLRILNIPPDKG